jgi:hypothetical protein
MLLCLSSPPAIRCDNEEHRGHRTHAGQHVGGEAFVARNINKRELLSRRQFSPGVAEVDRHTASTLLRPSIWLHAG